MDESSHKQLIVEVQFEKFTSQIKTYLGRVYVCNFNKFKTNHYHLDTNSNEWLISYMKKDHVPEVNEIDQHNYVGKQTIMRTNLILMKLLNLPYKMTNSLFADYVQKSSKAKEWATGLHKGKKLVDSWFLNGCPLNNQDLQQVIEWSQQQVTSDESTMSKGIADAILRTRKNKENGGNETRDKESIHIIPKTNFSKF